MLHAPVLWRPDPDYCTGIQPQSVFIRERAKIIQEGSGPLIHLKRRTNGWGWWLLEGGLKRGPWVILKGENPVERPWEPWWINTLWIIVSSFLSFFLVLSVRSAVNFPAIWDKLFVKSMSIPPLGIYSEKTERGRLQSSVRMVTTIWRIWLITSSASNLKFMLLIQTIITCLRKRFCIRTWSSLERSKPFVKPYNDTDRCFHKAMIYILKSGVNTCLQMQELNLPVCICITYHSLCSNTFTFLYLTDAKNTYGARLI